MASSELLTDAWGAVGSLLDHYGYKAVGTIIFLEDFGVPVPGETILIAAAAEAGAGHLNVVILAVVACIAAIVGDNVGFAIGHAGGRPLAVRYGKYVLLTEARLDKVQGAFQRYGGAIVTVARFVEGLRQLNGVVAGIARMRWQKFLLYNAIGAALWCGTWITVGYFVGSNASAIYATIRPYQWYALAVVAIAIAAAVVYKRWSRQSRSSPER